jgi:hypothetical protein
MRKEAPQTWGPPLFTQSLHGQAVINRKRDIVSITLRALSVRALCGRD